MRHSFDFRDQNSSADRKRACEILRATEPVTPEEAKKQAKKLLKKEHPNSPNYDPRKGDQCAKEVGWACEILFPRAPQSNDQRTPVSNRKNVKGLPYQE